MRDMGNKKVNEKSTDASFVKESYVIVQERFI